MPLPLRQLRLLTLPRSLMVPATGSREKQEEEGAAAQRGVSLRRGGRGELDPLPLLRLRRRRQGD